MTKEYYRDPILDDILEKIPSKVEREVELFMGIVYRIDEILKRKGWSRAELAAVMGKKESEISKWMSGSHNFTIATIARIESALGEDIINVKRYRKPVSGYDRGQVSKRRYLSDRKGPGYGK